MRPIRKYPRTRHIRGSRFQHGDHDMEAAPWSELEGRHLVIEEKIDGANCGLSFSDEGKLHLQSRGHYLTGGPREKHFNLLKQWASCHEEALFCAIGSRYIVFGEWTFAKHTAFYDSLPHHFHEFDVFDVEAETYLDTPSRRKLLANVPVISVPVIHEGPVANVKELAKFIGPSAYMTMKNKESLLEQAAKAGVSQEDILRQVDGTNLMEGLYVKREEGGIVTGRYKYVRAGFTSSIIDQETHWLNRPIVQNVLKPGTFENMFV